MSLMQTISASVDRWLTAPEVNAAGRMSLFRIVYGLFYLWYTRPLSYYAVWTRLPQDQWDPIVTFRMLNIGRPSSWVFEVLPVVLLVSLVLLTIGFRTRMATLTVLVSGMFLSGSYYSFTGKVDHADTFLVAYIPAVMLFSRWNSNYSLDALLKERCGVTGTSPDNSKWTYIWPMRALLLLLALLFFGAGYYKIRGGWLNDPHGFSRLLISQNAIAVVNNEAPNPVNVIISGNPLLYVPLGYAGVLFETLFPLALLGRRLRALFVSMGLFFHLQNVYLIQVNAFSMIIAYLVFVNWQAIYGRWWPAHIGKRLNRLSTPALSGLTLALALTVPILWRDINIIRPPMPDALISPVTIWYIVGPFAFYVMVKSLFSLARSGVGLLARRSHPATEAQLAR